MTPILRDLGQRIRSLRQDQSLTLKSLADASGLSVRFLGQLETGASNVSVLKLDQVARCLGTSPDRLLRPPRRIVALVGLRGAGKTTVGQALAERRRVRFLELDREIEQRAGMSLGELFSLHGEDYYRRLEGQVLRDLLGRLEETEPDGAVIATGGGIVSSPETWSLLRERTITVWLRARPEQHLARVAAQGDERPMSGHDDALAELKRLLGHRESLYAEAEAIIDTAELNVAESVESALRLM